jgi:hypothetical protein
MTRVGRALSWNELYATSTSTVDSPMIINVVIYVLPSTTPSRAGPLTYNINGGGRLIDRDLRKSLCDTELDTSFEI